MYLTSATRVAQAYIDGLKGPHQQAANLFVALMRAWSRMAVPCLAVKDGEGKVQAVRLSGNLERELRRAGYVEGEDFHAVVEVPHPSLADEAYRKVKRPLVRILEEILGNLEGQGIARRGEVKRIRDVLEAQYGIYPTEVLRDRAAVVKERRATYTAVQRLYGIRGLTCPADVESVGIRPLWARLMALSTDGAQASGSLDERARRALAHVPDPERVTL